MADAILLADADTIWLYDADSLLVPASTTAQVGSGLLGRRGPYIDENARRKALLRDDDDLLAVL